MANSDMAKKPFRTTSRMTTMISRVPTFSLSTRGKSWCAVLWQAGSLNQTGKLSKRPQVNVHRYIKDR